MRMWLILATVILLLPIFLWSFSDNITEEKAKDSQVKPPLLSQVRETKQSKHHKPTNDTSQGCSSGCSASSHPIPLLSRKEFHSLISSFSRQPMSEASPALEALLFYGHQTKNFLRSEGKLPLSQERLKFLERELSRNEAWVTLRIVDETGAELASVERIKVPLGVKQHLHANKLQNLQPLEFNGTVHRVGLHHLWTRM